MRAFLRAILESIRFEWRMQRALRRMERVDDDAHAQDTADLAAFDRRREARMPSCPIPIDDCRTCRPDPLTEVSSLDPTEVGRGRKRGEAILDVAAWLAASGFADKPEGYRQCYALWLLRKREAYERQQGASIS